MRIFDHKLKRPHVSGAASAAHATTAPSDEYVEPQVPLAANQGHAFSRLAIASSGATLQPKLALNTPGDAYEQEADRVAEQVLRMPNDQLQPSTSIGQTGAQVQTQRVAPHDGAQDTAPPMVDAVVGASGQPLDRATRAFMEPRFGHDFSQVQVHTDAKAVESAHAVHALAYTVGQDVVFGAGQYAPGTDTGQKLLAHELTHVIQQSPSATSPTSAPDTPHGARDSRPDAAPVAGGDMHIARATDMRLARKPDPASQQAPAPDQQPAGQATASRIEAEDVARLLDELLDLWYASSRFGINDVNLNDDTKAGGAFLIALGGNLLWASTSFLNPASAIAIRVLSVAGATLGSGTYDKVMAKANTVEICRDMAKDMLGKAYKEFGTQKSDLTTQLLQEFDKWGLRDRTNAMHADMRRQNAWEFLFDPAIPYNDVRALETSAKRDIEAIWVKFLAYWHGFQIYDLGKEYALQCYYEALVASGVADRAKTVKRYTSKVPEEVIRRTHMSGSVKHYEFPGGATVEKYPYDVNGQFGEYEIHVPK